MKYDVQGNGTHIYIGNRITEGMQKFGLYHFSKEAIGPPSPFMGWITNKMFYLNEDLAKHILIYQQVG